MGELSFGNQDLRVYPTEMLVNEIVNRFDNFIICGKRTSLKDKTTDETYFNYAGDETVCMGLTLELNHYIWENEREQQRD